MSVVPPFVVVFISDIDEGYPDFEAHLNYLHRRDIRDSEPMIFVKQATVDECVNVTRELLEEDKIPDLFIYRKIPRSKPTADRAFLEKYAVIKDLVGKRDINHRYKANLIVTGVKTTTSYKLLEKEESSIFPRNLGAQEIAMEAHWALISKRKKTIFLLSVDCRDLQVSLRTALEQLNLNVITHDQIPSISNMVEIIRYAVARSWVTIILLHPHQKATNYYWSSSFVETGRASYPEWRLQPNPSTIFGFGTVAASVAKAERVIVLECVPYDMQEPSVYTCIKGMIDGVYRVDYIHSSDPNADPDPRSTLKLQELRNRLHTLGCDIPVDDATGFQNTAIRFNC